MRNPIGKRRWVIAEGYIPSDDQNKPRELVSHESACLLNAAEQDAHVQLTVYFSDREPVGPYEVLVPAQRTRHVRFNELQRPKPIPKATDYSTVIESDVPIVVQHTRLDSRNPQVSLMTTLAFPSE